MPLALIWRGIIAILLIAVLGVQGQAETLLAVPALSAHVIDQTGTLDASQRGAMEQRLAEIEQKEGSQLVVLMVRSTAPEDIAAFANRVGNAWKIGRREVGDGVLIVVAKDDRKMRIEVAKTLEGAIPDLAAARIIDQAMKPRFRSGDFAGGLNAAIDQLAALIAGEPLPEPEPVQARTTSTSYSNWLNFAGVGFFAVLGLGHLVRAIFGMRVGALLMGGGVGVVAFFLTASVLLALGAGVGALLLVLLTGESAGGSPWSGGSSSGGSSSGGSSSYSGGDSGGFSSGGGGDFGGGGASGDW